MCIDSRLAQVLECSWNELESFIKSGEGDMAALIHAHEKYLSDLSVRGLLGTIDKEKVGWRVIMALTAITAHAFTHRRAS